MATVEEIESQEQRAEREQMQQMQRWIKYGVITLLLLIVGGMWGCPQYRVWQKSLAGKAQLAEAQYNRQIAVQEASAKQESAKHLAQAEIERAKGVAEANRIIGESLKGNHEYLTWLWIESLERGNGQVIYVPTEANLPVLEADRFNFLKPATPEP